MKQAKNCPVCRRPAIIETQSLEYKPGHGYPENFRYSCKCCNCNYIPAGNSYDVYMSKEEAINTAIDMWNKNVDEYNKIKK